MFGFGEVRTHLGVVFSDAFGIFEGLGWISEKIEEIRKIWAMSGVLRRGVVIPRRSEGQRQGVACPRHGVAKRRIWPVSSTPQRSEGLRHDVALFTS